jgi:hypothetical protein
VLIVDENALEEEEEEEEEEDSMSSKYRPSTAYSTLSPRSGRAVDVPWLLPPRAQTAMPYTKLEPTFGPRAHAVVSTRGLLEGGSALDRQNLKVVQCDLVPRPETLALPPLRAKTAADALYRSMERHGPMRGVDEGMCVLVCVCVCESACIYVYIYIYIYIYICIYL